MKPYKQIYEEILERKLRAYASELEHRVSSIKITPSESTVLAGATALPFSGMAEPKLNVAGKGIKSKVMGGVLAGALALTGSHIAGLQRSINTTSVDVTGGIMQQMGEAARNTVAMQQKTLNSLPTQPQEWVTYTGARNLVDMSNSDALFTKNPADFINQLKTNSTYHSDAPIELFLNGTPTISKEGRSFISQVADELNQPIFVSTPSGKFDYSKEELVRSETFYPKQYTPITERPVTITEKETPWMDYAKSYIGKVFEDKYDIQPNLTIEGSNTGLDVNRILMDAGVKPTASGAPWCASFVNHTLKRSNISTKELKHPALAKSWEQYGQKLDYPAYGAILTYQHGEAAAGGHAGFVVGVNAQNPREIILLGGNHNTGVSYIRKSLDDPGVVLRYPKGYTPNFSLKKYDFSTMPDEAHTLPPEVK